MSAAGGSSSSRPNFFDLLGLDPDAPWNQAEFERIVTEKRREWTRLSLQGIGQKQVLAKRNLGLIGAINRVMNDPVLRDKEAEQCRLGHSQDKRKLLDEFNESLRFSERKPYVLESEISHWAKEYAAIFPGGEADVRSHVKAPIRPSNARAAARPQLNLVRAKEIREHLQLLGYETLYELLSKELRASFSETTSLPILQQAADRLNREWQKRPDKTVDVTARIKLSGHAKDIFGSEDQRQRYQETLRQDKMTQRLHVFEKYCEGAQAIDATQSENFLNEAKGLGWDVEEAQERLVDLAARRRWPLIFSREAAAKIDEQQRCVYCEELHPKDARYCKNCRRQLRMDCPGCGKDVSLAESVCVHCGFAVGDFYPIQEMLQTLLDQDGHLLASLDLTEAKEIVDLLKQNWSPKNPDALARKIAGVWAEIQRRFDERKQLTERVLRLIANCHFCEARDLLPKLPPTIQGIPDWQKKLQEIKARTEAARRQVERAQQRGTREDERERAYWAALQESADCEEAREGLKRITPKPPWNLKLDIDKDKATVTLDWNASPSPGGEHVVVRKAFSLPASPSDGEILVSTPGNHYTDSTPPVGLSIFYAVFAQREGVVSKASAQAPQPAFFIQEATDLKWKTTATSVTLEWKPPPNVHTVTVVRKEGSAPQSLSDGVVLQPPAGQNKLLDEPVQEGGRYFYRVYCRFLNSQGSIVSSNGSQPVMVVPQGPPDPFKLKLDFKLRQEQISTWLDIDYPPPEKGEVKILKSDRPFVIPGEKDVDQLLTRHIEVKGNGGKTDRLSKQGEIYYLPLILFEGKLYVGEAQSYPYTKAVTDLKAYNLVTALALEWTWPDDTDEVQIGYDTTGWLRDARSAPKKMVVTRQEYNRLHRYELKAPGGMEYYLIVSPVITQQGKRVVGNGPQIRCYLGPKASVKYGFNRSRTKLTLQASQSIILPPLQIRTNASTWQITRTEGTFWDIPLIAEGHPKSKWDFDLPSAFFPPNTYGRVFLKEETDENKINLILPSPDQLKLS